MAENTIDNLSIQVVASAERAISTFNRLASGASGLRGAARGAAGGMQDMAQGAKDAGTATREAGERAGKAEKSTRSYGRAAKDAGDNAKKGSSGISTFWQSLKRIAYYRAIRSIIKGITDSFREGAQNLYQWSASTGLSDFAKNLDRISTSVNYLKNSLGAMLEPIVRIITPIIEKVVDGIVWLTEKISQLFAALSGAETYTAAKKVATTWSDAGQSAAGSARKAANDIKRTILGFDEINKLEKANDGGSYGGGGSASPASQITDMFEERPLEGWAKKLSDIIRNIKQWFDEIFGPIKQLFTDAGDAFDDLNRKMNAPEENGGNGLPATITPTPSAEKIWDDFSKAWDAIQGKILFVKILPSTPADLLFNMFAKAWDEAGSKILYFSPKFDNRADVLYNNFKNAWDEAGSKILYFSAKFDNKAKTLYNAFKKAWDEAGSKTLYFSPKMDNTSEVLYNSFMRGWDEVGSNTLYFSPKLDNKASVLFNDFKNDWNALPSRTVYVSPKLDNNAGTLFNAFKAAWNNIQSRTVYVSPKLDNQAQTLFNAFRNAWNGIQSRTVYVSPKLDNTALVLFTAFTTAWKLLKPSVEIGIKFTITAAALFAGLQADWKLLTSTVYVSPKLDNTGKVLFDNLKSEWNTARTSLFAAPKLDNTGKVLFDAFKKAWDEAKTTLTVSVSLIKSGWTTVEQYIDNSFGGASGGGGQTSGGGAGRSIKVKVDLSEGWTGTPQSALGLIGLTSDVSVGAVAQWAATIGGIVGFLGVSDPHTTVTADAASSWQWLGGTFKEVVGAGDTTSTITAQNAKRWSNTYKEAVGAEDTTTTITADISTAWDAEGKTALQYMKLSGLKVTIPVAVKPKSGASNITLTADAHDVNKWTVAVSALGGIFNHGRRTNIPQYAGGTLNAHGSLFLAGEAGPEIVGHVGGRTEVLNKSQLASAMFSAVRAALAPAAANFAYAAQAMGTTSSSEPNYAGLYEIIRDAMGNALANDNGNRERNQLLREINDKDMNVEVSTSSINKAQTRMNRRAGTTIVAVGT